MPVALERRIVDSAGHVRLPVDGYRCTVGACRQWTPASEWYRDGDDGTGTCPTCLTYHDETQMRPERQWQKTQT